MPALFVAAALKSGQIVAVRAAHLLVEAGATRILDVGSGPGKFCITGALTTAATFTGVEQRQQLVEVARAVAFRIGADRARFLHANVLKFPFNRFDGFYLYNPFYECLDETLVRIDDTVPHSSLLFQECVRTTIRKLARLPVGVAVVTSHGFGGVLPRTYSRVHEEVAGSDRLVLWIKTAS
jgi:SAM-dependent methyltransferase